MANQWFRLYSEFAIDAKIQSMDETLQRRYIMLLCLRCNGDVTRSVTDENEIACYMRISVDELKKTKEVFIKKKFIDDRWNVLNWNKRQFISDSSTERVARHREKKKNDGKISNKNVTKCNVTVTPPDSDSESYLKDKSITNVIDSFLSLDKDEKPEKQQKDNCPYQEIAKSYHEQLPELSTIQALNDKRKRQIKAMWKNHLKTLTEWENYFKFVRRSDFLMGKVQCNGRTRFKCSIDFLINENNFLKICEDKYHG